MPADYLLFLFAVFVDEQTGLPLLQDAAGRVGSDDLSLSQYRDPVAQHRLVHQVRADKERRALPRELPEGVPEPVPELRVHGGRRLV
jgi:hypothetical protein